MIRSLVLICVSAFLSGACGAAPVPATSTATPGVTSFRSDLAHLAAPLPPGWAAAEGPQSLARPFTGLVSFNNWGQAGFWAPQITTGSGSEYSTGTVMRQMPADGAYIVLVDQIGGPAPGSYGPEYALTDLSGLWSKKDCRSAVNSLLAGWRFDRVPTGELGWAVVSARGLLPSAVGPSKFPIIAGPPYGTAPAESSRADGTELRATQTLVKDKNILVTFTYHWSDLTAPGGPSARAHSWQYQARPSGDVALISDSGDALPSP